VFLACVAEMGSMVGKAAPATLETGDSGDSQTIRSLDSWKILSGNED
jgi:hypothetical protein